jgi:predicted  nucleic acid-binding Zn-ribbon protein
MTKTNLKKELDAFKAEMQQVNNSFANFEAKFAIEKKKLSKLRQSFAHIVKLINHELVQALEHSSRVAKELLGK